MQQRKCNVLCILVLLPLILNGQVKFDYNWVLGYNGRAPDPGIPLDSAWGGVLVNFNVNPPTKDTFSIPIWMNSNTSISDSSGHLLFYANGCVIENRQNQVMLNGSEINYGGWAYKIFCKTEKNSSLDGYEIHQGALILPFPDHLTQYIYIYLHKPADQDLISREILYSKVDMALDNGLGAVTEKNTLVLHDSFVDMITAVRHGNGRDWWIIIPELATTKYFTFLLSPKGITGPWEQKIGDYPIIHWAFGNQACFSPDGTKYANLGLHPDFFKARLQVFDFDRCLGKLSNVIEIPFTKDTVSAAGVAFSSSSRFLYVGTGTNLYQFDMNTSPVSQMKIGSYDGFEDPVASLSLPTNFYQMLLAPDNKIYMTAPNTVRYWHIIQEPDRWGKKCTFVQHVRMPFTLYFSLPNFPHFRLYDAQGSPCDTLNINGPQPPHDTATTIPPPPTIKCSTAWRPMPLT
jgi:hypothetical protein